MASSKLLAGSTVNESVAVLGSSLAPLGPHQTLTGHENEVDLQWHRLEPHIDRPGHVSFALQREHHTMVYSRATRVSGEILGMNFVIPRLTPGQDQDEGGQACGVEGNDR